MEEKEPSPYEVNINGSIYFIKEIDHQIDIEGPGVKSFVYRSLSSRESNIIVKGNSSESTLALILYFNRDNIPQKV